MVKIRIEVCLISARGLQRSSLWKLQWFAVGWVDPNNKYCTKIDASGNANPVWKTKFSTVVDDSESESKFQDLGLYVEVYSRDPIFLREKLQGTATVNLREFLAKHANKSSEEASNPGRTQDVGSFQLRKGKSSKPHGFVDISIRISGEKEETDSYSGKEEGIELMDHNRHSNGGGITLAPAEASTHAYAYPPPQRPVAPPHHGQPQNPPPTNFPYSNPMPFPTNYSKPSAVGGTSYPPPPPPPPSNVGYIPTFLPRTDHLPGTYVNMPPSSGSSGAGRGGGPGFGMGVGAGALAAGAVIFGDDFMSGFDFPTGLQDASLTISTDPLF